MTCPYYVLCIRSRDTAYHIFLFKNSGLQDALKKVKNLQKKNSNFPILGNFAGA